MGDLTITVEGLGQLRDNWGRFLSRLDSEALAAGQQWAQETQTVMRAEAPWQDRTGEARQGLLAEATAPPGEGVYVNVYGASDHNLWLEVAHGGQYAIIWPTVQQRAGLLPAYFAQRVRAFTA